MNRTVDIAGQRFARLTVQMIDGNDNHGHTTWKCRCDCGNSVRITATKLRRGHTRSCGCLKNELREERFTTHGHAKQNDHSPEYRAWYAMKTRCSNKNQRNYDLYGGRGIKVCDRWNQSFDKFLTDVGNKPSPKHSLDRIDPNDDYTPDNCKWSTATEQSRNQRIRKDNKSGVRGVLWLKRSEKWHSTIKVDKIMINLGRYKDLDEAIQARKEAEIKYWNKKPS